MSSYRARKSQEEFKQLERKKEVANQYLQGYSQGEIAKGMGLAVGTIQKILGEVRKEWLEKIARDFDTRKAEELAKLDRIEAAAWESWEKSKEVHQVKRVRTERVRQKVVTGKPKKGHPPPKERYEEVPVRTTTEVIDKGQCGDPRFLDTVYQCVEMRIKILGLVKGEKTTGTLTINWGDMMMGQIGQTGGRERERLPPPSNHAGGEVRRLNEAPPHDTIEARILAVETRTDQTISSEDRTPEKETS